jgi:hypothetical protein
MKLKTESQPRDHNWKVLRKMRRMESWGRAVDNVLSELRQQGTSVIWESSAWISVDNIEIKIADAIQLQKRGMLNLDTIRAVNSEYRF